MKENIKCDADLLKLLRKSDVIEIDFLVDVLTDNGAGRVALSSAIKDLLIDEKAGRDYSEDALRRLLREFQEFGGHSVANFFRSEPLPYSELLTDVYKKLNGKNSEKKTVIEKEREIVLSLLGAEWQSMADHERWDRCTEAKVLSGFFNMQDFLHKDTSGVFVGLSAAASAAAFVGLRALPPAAIASSLFMANQSIGEAYRITIPFVVQIARMRMIAAM